MNDAPRLIGIEPSFGFGDRTGLATPGHVAAMRSRGAGIESIFPQQSIREMTRTGRSPGTVMNDALEGMRASGWDRGTGADADHLKTEQDVSATAEVGFTFFTIDPSDHVDERTDAYDEQTLRAQYAAVRDNIDWFDDYLGRTIRIAAGIEIVFDEEACMRCAVKYGRAIVRGIELANSIRDTQQARQQDYEIELSVDETENPTTLAEHWIVADQFRRRGVPLVSLAPRFIGACEKGVDYLGDVDRLEGSLVAHAAVAERLGPYKLSLHSGSDKLSMYAALARATNGRFHVKTAGTSYLEAVRVAAIREPQLFREICGFARTHYEVDRATYHVHATLENVPPPDELPDVRAVEKIYLERWEDVPRGRGFSAAGRQILHCTFGSVLTDPRLGPALKACLVENPDTYRDVLCEHFTRHLDALQS